MSTGAVFHPEHDEWHGLTVVVYTSTARTLVGRWDAVVGDEVTMRDVAVHEEGAAAEPRDAWVQRLKQFGIPVAHRAFALPRADVSRVVHLRDA